MKKRLIPLLVVGLLASAVATPVIVSAEVFPVACADYTGGSGYTELNPKGGYDLQFGAATAEPCGGVLFTMFVFEDEAACLDANTNATLAVITVHGARRSTDPGFGSVVFKARSLPDTDGIVFAFGTSSQRGTAFDRAPDTGCVDITEDPGAKPFG